MEIGESARKHGVADADMLHAIANAVLVFDLDDMTMVIGPDRVGRLLEVAVLTEQPVIVHAMPARSKFLR